MFLHIRGYHVHVHIAKLPHELSTLSTRQYERVLHIRAHCHCSERAAPLADCFEVRSALRTDRQTVRYVLDVAARNNRVVGEKQAAPHPKFAVGGVGVGFSRHTGGKESLFLRL